MMLITPLGSGVYMSIAFASLVDAQCEAQYALDTAMVRN